MNFSNNKMHAGKATFCLTLLPAVLPVKGQFTESTDYVTLAGSWKLKGRVSCIKTEKTSNSF